MRRVEVLIKKMKLLGERVGTETIAERYIALVV